MIWGKGMKDLDETMEKFYDGCNFIDKLHHVYQIIYGMCQDCEEEESYPINEVCSISKKDLDTAADVLHLVTADLVTRQVQLTEKIGEAFEIWSEKEND